MHKLQQYVDDVETPVSACEWQSVQNWVAVASEQRISWEYA